MTDIKQMIGENLLGIDSNIFEAVNDMKKTLLEKLSNQEISVEETAKQIMELIDNTFKE
jgi:hypothetical protein